MQLIIHYNGSKFPGDSPDGIEILEERLRKYTLTGFSTYRNIKNGINIWGNFVEISAVFNIDIFDKKIATKMKGLICQNFKKNKPHEKI